MTTRLRSKGIMFESDNLAHLIQQLGIGLGNIAFATHAKMCLLFPIRSPFRV